MRKLLMCIVLLLACSSTIADTITVTLEGSGDYTEIQPAIDAAVEGEDAVLVLPGEYEICDPITFRGKAITVWSEAGPDATVIRMCDVPADPERSSVVAFESGENAASVLEGFTLTGGEGSVWHGSRGLGGGVFCVENSSPTLANCTIAGNAAVYGGGVCCEDSSPILTNCTISGNRGWDGGAITCYHSDPTIRNCTITENMAVYGAVYCEYKSRPTLTNCIVWNNPGISSIYIAPPDDGEFMPVVRYSCIERKVWQGAGNINVDPSFCGWDGGEVWAEDQGGFEEALGSFSLALSSRSPCIGTGTNGANMGADYGVCETPGEATRLVHLAPGTYAISGLNLCHRVSLEGAGEEETVLEGAVRGLRTGAVISHLTVTAGTDGGVIVARGEKPEISSCTITANSGSGVLGSSPTLTNCTISRNAVGGVSCDGSPILTNCTITKNSGGGVRSPCQWATGSPFLTNCAISGNSGFGVSSSHPTLTNCTISANSGIGVSGDHSTLTNCTISGNSGTGVSGYRSLTLTNCIVWDNAGGSIYPVAEPTPEVRFCCIEDEEAWSGEGNINQDPLFVHNGVFDFNRFVTVEIGGQECSQPDFVVQEPDFHLQADSPAVDAGTCVVDYDMDNNRRPRGEACDIGAYEYGSSPASRFIRADSNTDGKLDIADPIFTLMFLFAEGSPPTCLDAADVNDDGAVDVADGIYILQNLFASGPTIPLPYSACGVDPTVDDLDCAEYPGCQE